MTLTKPHIVERIATVNGFTKKRSFEAVETLLEIIKQTLESGEDVLVSGFGKFCVKEKNKRLGRNPATGTQLMLDPRKIVTFKCSGSLRAVLNDDQG
jgi:integration host factor subunit alpha